MRMRSRILLSLFAACIFYIAVSLAAGYQKNSPVEKAPISSNSNTSQPQDSLDFPTPVPTRIPSPTPTPRTIPESELIEAINIFRRANGRSQLTRNDGLCTESQKRVQDLLQLARQNGKITLNHDGFEQDVKSGRATELTGKYSFGENIAAAQCLRPSDQVAVNVTTGVQLVEWCFASSSGHRDDLLNPEWTDVCSVGQYPIYVENFAK